MKVFAMFYYGPGFSAPDQFNRRDIEEFSSLKEFKNEFQTRLPDPYYPGADEKEYEAWVMFEDPFEDGDLYPDRIAKLGPRGGVRVERC